MQGGAAEEVLRNFWTRWDEAATLPSRNYWSGGQNKPYNPSIIAKPGELVPASAPKPVRTSSGSYGDAGARIWRSYGPQRITPLGDSLQLGSHTPAGRRGEGGRHRPDEGDRHRQEVHLRRRPDAQPVSRRECLQQARDPVPGGLQGAGPGRQGDLRDAGLPRPGRQVVGGRDAQGVGGDRHVRAAGTEPGTAKELRPVHLAGHQGAPRSSWSTTSSPSGRPTSGTARWSGTSPR